MLSNRVKRIRTTWKITPIDGSGGDAGVEFYLTLPNGDEWGWQCKFFQDDGRLSPKRKTQIKRSLETACKNHLNLKKYFICLKTDLTVDIKTKKGELKRGEKNWFENELTKAVPSSMGVE